MKKMTKFSPFLRKLLIRIAVITIMFYAKIYFNLDPSNYYVDQLITTISAFFLLEFSTFINEIKTIFNGISKTFFNGSIEKGEGSNSRNNNNNNSNQGWIVNPRETSGLTPDNPRVVAIPEELDQEEERRIGAEALRLMAECRIQLQTNLEDHQALNIRLREKIRQQ